MHVNVCEVPALEATANLLPEDSQAVAGNVPPPEQQISSSNSLAAGYLGLERPEHSQANLCPKCGLGLLRFLQLL